MKLPLRERKKIETRNRIVEVANAMFRERGFAGTTLDQIADHGAEIFPEQGSHSVRRR